MGMYPFQNFALPLSFNRIKMTFAEKTLFFYQHLSVNTTLPSGIEVMNPYRNPETLQVCHRFYHQYFNDNQNRHLILGINPGRFGAGVTGIPFTDPIQLEKTCDIPNSFAKKPELSSQFVYRLIQHMGGPTSFYKRFYIGAVSPLGFIKNGKNFNYYDDKALENSLKPFITKSIQKQIALGVHTDKCYCFGNGKNFSYLQKLNDEFRFFGEIIPLPHPRWVMQYRKKKLPEFLESVHRKLETK